MKKTQLSPEMKFEREGGEYAVYRMTYRGEGGWSYPLGVGKLGALLKSKPSADGGLRDGIVSWQRPIAVGVDTPASLAQHGGDGSSDGAEAAS